MSAMVVETIALPIAPAHLREETRIEDNHLRGALGLQATKMTTL